MEVQYDSYNGLCDLLIDFHEVLTVRSALCQTLFREPEVQSTFMSLIQQAIDPIKCEYNPEQLTYTIKVKKTSVKRMPNYRPEVSFYYNIVCSIMQQILTIYKDQVIQIFMRFPQILNIAQSNDSDYMRAYSIYNKLISNQYQLCNLVNVQCISDGVIQIIM